MSSCLIARSSACDTESWHLRLLPATGQGGSHGGLVVGLAPRGSYASSNLHRTPPKHEVDSVVADPLFGASRASPSHGTARFDSAGTKPFHAEVLIRVVCGKEAVTAPVKATIGHGWDQKLRLSCKSSLIPQCGLFDAVKMATASSSALTMPRQKEFH